jgi:hypothetical protein
MAQADLEELFNAVLPFAQQMLAKYGEFYPIGAAMNSGGEVGLVGCMPESEHPPSQEIINMLTAELQQEASKHEIRASVLCFDGSAIPPGEEAKVDAICAHLEHESGECVAAFLPYRKEISGQVTYGELFAGRLKPQIFVSAATE